MFNINNIENLDIRNRSKTFSIHNNYIKNFVPALRPKKNLALVSPIRLEKIDEIESLCDFENFVLKKKYNNSYSCPNTDDEDNNNKSIKDNNDFNNEESFSDFELNFEKNEEIDNNNNNIIINEKNIKSDFDNSNNNSLSNKKENNNNNSNEDLNISPISINSIKNDRKELKNIRNSNIRKLSKEYENILSLEDNNLYINLNNNNKEKKNEYISNLNKKRRTSFFKKYIQKEMNIKEDMDNDKKNLRKTISNISLGNYFMLRVLSSAYEDNFNSDNNNILINKNLRNTIS
jgi:hypothetical protein